VSKPVNAFSRDFQPQFGKVKPTQQPKLPADLNAHMLRNIHARLSPPEECKGAKIRRGGI
jgi:hypothetical protein